MSDLKNCIPFSLQVAGYELACEHWDAASLPNGQAGVKAVVGIIHGFGEHQGRYGLVAKIFVGHGLITYTLDLPGHGRSTGRRGHMKSIAVYLEAIACLLAKIQREHPGLPLALFGHSMGGGLVARYLVDNPTSPVDAAIISSPWIKLPLKPPKAKLLLGRTALKLGLSLSQSADLDPTLLSQDPQIQKEFTEDPLVHNSITPQTFFGILDSGKHLLKKDHKTVIPVLFTHGTDDQITSLEATQRLSYIWGMHSSFKAWEAMRHEPHNDIGKDEVIAFYAEWLLESLKVEV